MDYRNLRNPSYTLREYFEDVLLTFPELDLFFLGGQTASSGLERMPDVV